MRIRDWSSDVCSSDLPPLSAEECPVRTLLRQPRERGPCCSCRGHRLGSARDWPPASPDRSIAGSYPRTGYGIGRMGYFSRVGLPWRRHIVAPESEATAFARPRVVAVVRDGERGEVARGPEGRRDGDERVSK